MVFVAEPGKGGSCSAVGGIVLGLFLFAFPLFAGGALERPTHPARMFLSRAARGMVTCARGVARAGRVGACVPTRAVKAAPHPHRASFADVVPTPEGTFRNTDGGPARVSFEARTSIKGRLRFYKKTGYRESAEVPGMFEVTLDGRAVKAAGRVNLRVPSMDMAMVIAAEWGSQGPLLEPSAMPTMSMAATSQLMGDKRASVIFTLLKFVETDTVCVRSPPGEDKKLVAAEKKHWDPVVGWFRGKYGHVHTSDGFVIPEQPEQTAAAVRAELEAMDDWRLTAVQALVRAGASLPASFDCSGVCFIGAVCAVRRVLCAGSVGQVHRYRPQAVPRRADHGAGFRGASSVRWWCPRSNYFSLPVLCCRFRFLCRRVVVCCC